MGAEEPLHFLTKTDLANHKKRKITETETGMETYKLDLCQIETENMTFKLKQQTVAAFNATTCKMGSPT